MQTHTYADGPATENITVDLKDEDGTFTSVANALAVSVTNVAPTIALTGNATAIQNAPYSLTLGPVTDPGTDTVASYTIHWGDGANTGPVSGNPNGQVVKPTPTPRPRPAARSPWTSRMKTARSSRPARSRSRVNPVPPTIVLSGNATVNEGALYSLTLGAVTAPSGSPISAYTIHWGDGATTGPVSGNPTGQIVTHTYANGPTSPTITVDLTDGNGLEPACRQQGDHGRQRGSHALGLEWPGQRQLRRHQALHLLDHRSRHARYLQRGLLQCRRAGDGLEPVAR